MRRNSEIILAEEYPFISKMLEPLHEMVIILDQERKIQYFNNSFQNFANQFGLNAALGILPGDAFNCIHALAGDELCGNTAFCKYCGGNHAIIKSMQGESGENECRIVSDNGNAFDLKVNTSPMEISGKEYTLYCITDASSENRRQNLEKIFFHDVNNLVNGMSLIMELIADNIKENRQPELYENVVLLDSSLASLKNEIQAQYLLALAEKDDMPEYSSQRCCKIF